MLQVRDGVMNYVRGQYGSGTGASESSTIQNKVADTLTSLFVGLYRNGWESFFDDFHQLAEQEAQNGFASTRSINLYLRVLASIHDEIADQMIQATSDRPKEHSDLKDTIRVRDAAKIAAFWQRTISRWRDIDQNVTELCLRNISKWVSWTDISLIVNEAMLNDLFQIASQREFISQYGHSRVRDAAIEVFTEIISKKMKPAEKIDLMHFLNLVGVINALVTSPALHDARGSPDYDTDMAEVVGKLVNNAMEDIVSVIDKGPADNATKEKAGQLMQAFVPFVLRFFTDEYDEVCSSVISALTDLLTFFRKLAKTTGSLPTDYSNMLSPVLDAIVAKTRFDESCSWGEESEQSDEGEFQELRKRLKVLQQILAAIDENLYLDTLTKLIAPIFSRFQSDGSRLDWRDLDLAMYEMFLLGEQAIRNGGIYTKKAPSGVASERMISMMTVMIESDVASYPHPSIHQQYMETCVRHYAFFEQNPQHVEKALENFVRFAHSNNIKVRAQAWHLFLRFVRHLRSQLGSASQNIVRAIEDLLVIKAELPENDDADDVSSTQDDAAADTQYNSQLHLFEAVGCLASSQSVSIDTQVMLARSVIDTLCTSIQQHIGAATSGDARAVLQIHHCMMALGQLARGFSDWIPGTSGSPIIEQISNEFTRASETVLVALDALKASEEIRTAGRGAFSRLIGVIGFKILHELPRWIDGLLAPNSSKDEVATFLRLLDQVIFGFKTQIYSIMDTLLTPLLRRIFTSFSEQTTGTDDEIQLGELRREYLNFLIVILSNDLQSIFVSATNQAIFESIIETIEHFARDTSDHPDAKLALSVITKMCIAWGGADIPNPASNPQDPAPSLPGFDQFMMTRFSALTWKVMTSSVFDPKNPQANRVLGEIAVLQQAILAKTGRAYLTWLRETELRGLGLPQQTIDDYSNALVTTDGKAFKNYLLRFLQAARG
jgi:exportin-T